MTDTLEVRLQAKGCPDAFLQGDYDVADTLLEVLDEYCHQQGLSAQCCRLFHDGKSLAKNKLLGQVNISMGNLQAGSANVTTQVASVQIPYNTAGVTRIDVEVNQPPLAFFLRHIFKGTWLLVRDLTPSVWLAIAEAFSKRDEIVRITIDNSLLTDMVSLEPSECVPISSSTMQDGLTGAVFKTARQAIHPLLVLLQLLQNPSALPRLSAQTQPAEQSSVEADQSAAQAIKLAQPNDHLSAPMRRDPSAADSLIQLMRVLVTSCKLASLIRVEVVSPAAESAQMLLFQAIHLLQLTVTDSLKRHASVRSQNGTADDSPELETLHVRSVQVIMPGFKQALKIIKLLTDPSLSADPKLALSEAYAESCLSTLQMLLTSGHQQHRMIAANEIFRLGIMPLILSCLERTTIRGYQALCVLLLLVANDKSKQAALARMHGMLHLSKMLRPVAVDNRTTDSHLSSSERRAAGPLSHIMPHNLQILLKTAQLMQDLLSHDPFSRQLVTVSHSSCVQAALPGGASPSSPTGLKTTSAGDQQSPVVAENGDNALDSQPEEVLNWCTPSAAAWGRIQQTACRAAACIQWAQSEIATMDQSQQSTLPQYNHLIDQLVMLLHDLLLGHMADPKLDLGHIFAIGLIPLMHQWKAWVLSGGPSLAKLTALGIAMLQRLASDASLTQLDECDPHWWTLSAAYFGRVHSIWELLETMSAWEDRHTDPSDKGQIPVITSAAIKALQSIPQLGMDGWHLVMHAAILTGFSAVIASHPSLATRLTACAVMANTCYASTVFAGDLRQMGYAMDATKSTLMCATLINQQDMVIRIYRLIQEGLQVQQPWSRDHCQVLTEVLDRAALFCGKVAVALPQPPQAIVDLLCDVLKQLPDVSGLARTDMSRFSLLKAALSMLSVMRGFSDLTVPQDIFPLGLYQWMVVQHHQDLSSVECLQEEGLVLSSGLCILQGLLDAQSASEGSLDVADWEGSLGYWAGVLVNLGRADLDNSLYKAGAAQMTDGAIKTYIRILPHYLALDFGEQIYEAEKMRRSVALAGLRYLAALIVHAAHMDSRASVAPESLTPTEAANTSVTDACKDDVLKLLRKVQAHESKGKTRLKERAATVAMYIGQIVQQMDALCKANTLWASAFSDAAQDNSWFFGVSLPTNNEIYTVLGQALYKLLLEPGVLAGWAEQSSAVIIQAAQFFPKLGDSEFYHQAVVKKAVSDWKGKLEVKKEAANQAAEVAGQQLLAEEEQRQARAAAKKAKKQRQKAKKAQPVDSVAEAVGSLDLEAEQAVDSSEQPSPSAANAPATSALLTDANMLQLFRCPITKAVMVEPVIAADGHTYERAAMQHWLQHHPTSPVTQALLPHTRLVPNLLIKGAIASQRQQLSQAAHELQH